MPHYVVRGECSTICGSSSGAYCSGTTVHQNVEGCAKPFTRTPPPVLDTLLILPSVAFNFQFHPHYSICTTRSIEGTRRLCPYPYLHQGGRCNDFNDSRPPSF
ncbi:unnamed protein product [Ectocarpus sp. 13 AM-2016]